MKKTSNVDSNYDSRGTLGESFMSKMTSYKYIMQYARDLESGLDIQLRGKYINIYYEGGNLLKLSGNSCVEFDENYFYQPNGCNFLRMTDIERLCSDDYINKSKKSKFLKEKTNEELKKYRLEAFAIKKSVKEQRDKLVKALKVANTFQETKDIIDKMKCKMHSWKECLKKNKLRKEIVGERVVQHYLSLFNKECEKNSQFIVLDLEYAISTKARYAKEFEREKQPRIDIVAIEKSTGQVYVMELKYGMKSVDGNASAKKHYYDYKQTVGDELKWKDFILDIQKLLEAKQAIGIISKEIFINKESMPTFIFIMKCESIQDKIDFKKHLQENELCSIPTIYLSPEKDYNLPSKEGHILKLL